MKRPILFFAIGLFAALFAACYLQAAFVLLLSGLSVLLCAALWYLTKRKAREPGWFYAALGLVFGFLVWQAALQLTYRPVLRYDGAEGMLSAVVTEYPAVSGRTTRVTVRMEALNGEKLPQRKALLYLRGYFGDLTPGDRIRVQTALSVPESTAQFDRFRYYRAHGVFLQGSTEGEPEVTRGAETFRYFPVRLRRLCTDRLYRLLPAENASVLSALLFGDRSMLTDGFTDDLRAVGLSHMVAVSGMHLSFLVGFLLLVFRKRVGSWIAIPVIVLFMLMTGCSASVLRAGIMQLVWVTAYLLGREADAPSSLAFAGCLILTFNPFAAADTALWLSFSATIGIMLLSGPIRNFFMRRIGSENRTVNGIAQFFSGILGATLSAQLFVTPVQTLVFGELTLIAPLAGLLVMPVAEITFVGAVTALLLSFLWLPLGELAALLPRFLTDYQIFLIPKLAGLPFSSIGAKNTALQAAVIIVFLFILYLAVKKPKRRTRAYIALSICLGAVVLFGAADRLLFTKISVAAAGRGQSVIVCDRDADIVINCGGREAGDCAEVLEALERSAVRSVSLFVLTDYAQASAGNAETFLASIRVKSVFLPEANGEEDRLRRREIEAAAVRSGAEVIGEDGERLYQMGSVIVRLLPCAEEGPDRGKLMAFIGVGEYRLLYLGSLSSESAAHTLRKAHIEAADTVAAGVYYPGAELPDEMLRPQPQCFVLQSADGMDSDVLFRMMEKGTDVVETEITGVYRVRKVHLYSLEKQYAWIA